MTRRSVGCLRDYLVCENFEVVCAADGEEACKKFEDGIFCIVLLDLMIPKISGMDVMQHIRQKVRCRSSSYPPGTQNWIRHSVSGMGADDYITKPFSVTEVLARIKAISAESAQYAAAVQPEEPVEPIYFGRAYHKPFRFYQLQRRVRSLI